MDTRLVRNLEYKEWRDFLVSVNDDLNIINDTMRKCYINKLMILDFSNLLNVLAISKSAYIYNQNILKDLQKIEDNLYSGRLIKDVESGIPAALINLSKKFIALKHIYIKIVREFSAYGLIPTITETENSSPEDKYLGVAV